MLSIVFKLCMLMQMSLSVTAQRSPLMAMLRTQQLLQNRGNLLRLTTLNNIQNQAGIISRAGLNRIQIPPIATTIRNRNNIVNSGSPNIVPRINTNGMLPVDVLLRQQRNLQSHVLQNLINAQRSLANSQLSTTVNSNENLNTNTLFNQGDGGTSPVDNVRVVLINDNSMSSNNRDLSNNQNSFEPSSSSTSQASSVVTFTNPFISTVGNANSRSGTNMAQASNQNTFEPSSSPTSQRRNDTVNRFISGFGGFGFPSTSASFWTGSASVGGSQPTPTFKPKPIPTSQSTRVSNTRTATNGGQFASPSASSNPSGSNSVNVGSSNANSFPTTFGNSFGKGRTFFTGWDTGSGTGSGITTGGGAFTSNFGSPSSPIVPSPSSNRPPALSCTADFQKMADHTLCKTDSPDMTKNGVVIDDTLMITQLHNDLRAGVQPPASDLMKLQWDDRLAAVAEKWAKQCTLAHDKERSIPDIGMSIGQNVAVGYESWQESIQQWYDEIRMYRYGFNPASYLGVDGWREIAHFTQMVNNGTYLVGCGYAECPKTKYVRYYVCNYASGQSDLAYPYTAGSRCGSCPNSCFNGLCECGGLICLNKGKLDPSTCTCKCPKPYKGSRCEIVDCPPEDDWICGRDWPPHYCDRYTNVPEQCPFMCGICEGGRPSSVLASTPSSQNLTFTSAFGCRYTGLRDDAATCIQYGEKGADAKVCASEGGSVGCGECGKYFNIKKDYCPVMCGLCDSPCAGKKCLNGGTLNSQTCTCSCKKPFAGETCELAQCPKTGDPEFCKFWPQRYCRRYFNVPEECPYMCGICKDTNPTVVGRPARRRSSDQ